MCWLVFTVKGQWCLPLKEQHDRMNLFNSYKHLYLPNGFRDLSYHIIDTNANKVIGKRGM